MMRVNVEGRWEYCGPHGTIFIALGHSIIGIDRPSLIGVHFMICIYRKT